MPRGTIRQTTDGRTWRQVVDDTSAVPCSPGTCDICFIPVDNGSMPIIEPPAPPFPRLRTLDELLDHIEEKHVMGEAKRKKKAVAPYVHPAVRVPGATVRDPAALCSHCEETHASVAEPLQYAYRPENTLDLVCRECLVSYYTHCEEEDCYAYNYVEIYGDEGYFSRAYAQRECVHDPDSDNWFRSREQLNDYTRARRRGELVYGYHATNPVSAFGWPPETEAHELCFGVELEMERKGRPTSNGLAEMSDALGGRDGSLQELRDAGKLAGRYILARDGSLNETGVELITSPYTLGYHQHKFGWSTLLEQVKGIGMSGVGTDRCGMHVHCNRQAISALTLGKMLVFANSPHNKILVERIAQRNGDTFAQKRAKKIVDGKRVRGEQKYDALNITTGTIEFRIFKGNLRPERVLKNIEFCHALITYSQTASIAACHTYEDFIKWLGENRGSYKNLVKFLAPQYGYKLSREDTSNDI